MNEMEYGDYHELIAWELRYIVRRYSEYWEMLMYKEEHERPRYTNEVEIRRLTVVVLTCVFLESVINFYLCTKLSTDDFQKVDRLGLEKKWSQIPASFLTGYSLSSSPDLLRDLHEVTQRRHAIAHSKPKISIDGDNRHAGNEPTPQLDEHAFIGRCASLPERLVANLLNSDSDSHFLHLIIQNLCASIASEIRYGEYWIKQCGTEPEALVIEIMSQGYDRETARRFAVYIGEFPKRDRIGKIIVRRGRTEVARLNPLKFLENTKDV